MKNIKILNKDHKELLKIKKQTGKSLYRIISDLLKGDKHKNKSANN